MKSPSVWHQTALFGKVPRDQTPSEDKDMIYCLLNSGAPLPNAASNALLETAKKMARQKEKKMRFRNHASEGMVETQWDYASMGAISGIKFTARVEAGNKTSDVEFIVRTFDFSMEDGDWKWFDNENEGEVAEFNRRIAEDAMAERDENGTKLN